MIEPHLRPGYTALEAARLLAPDDPAWDSIMTDFLQLPMAMLDSVQREIRIGIWARSINPLRCVKENTERHYMRKMLSWERALLRERNEEAIWEAMVSSASRLEP